MKDKLRYSFIRAKQSSFFQFMLDVLINYIIKKDKENQRLFKTKFCQDWYLILTTHVLNFEAFESFKVLNAKLRVVSILLADNDDIRSQPALAIYSTKNSYGLIFYRSPFWKFFLQVLSEIKVFVSWQNWQSRVS